MLSYEAIGNLHLGRDRANTGDQKREAKEEKERESGV